MLHAWTSLVFEAVMCLHGPAIPRAGYTFQVSRASLGSARPGHVMIHLVAGRNLRRHIQRCRAGVIGSADVRLLAAAAAWDLPSAA